MIDRVPGFEGRHRGVQARYRGRRAAHTKRRNAPRRETAGFARLASIPAAEALQAHHADQDEQTSQGRNVVRVEVRIEVGSQAEDEDREQHPSESVFPQAQEKRGQRQKQRREKEETIEADAAGPTLPVAAETIGARAVSFRLRFVVELLLARQRPMRGGDAAGQ